MYGLSRLYLLQEINLSNNGIVTIEGLKELVNLRHLNLQGNNIKIVEHLNANVQLEHLNLSENNIGTISDISMLKNLKVWQTRIFFKLFRFMNISSACVTVTMHSHDYELV